jgi:hypothetical protein
MLDLGVVYQVDALTSGDRHVQLTTRSARPARSEVTKFADSLTTKVIPMAAWISFWPQHLSRRLTHASRACDGCLVRPAGPFRGRGRKQSHGAWCNPPLASLSVAPQGCCAHLVGRAGGPYAIPVLDFGHQFEKACGRLS